MAVEGGSKKTTISLKPIAGVEIGDDVVIIEVSPAIANHMKTILPFIEDDSFDASTAVIPLPNVSAFQLKKIIEYLNFLEPPSKAKVEESELVPEVTAAIDGISVDNDEEKKNEKSEKAKAKEKAKAVAAAEMKEFEKKFMEDVSRKQLLELVVAAHYLNVQVALDFLNGKVADVIENRSVKFVRDYFGIVPNYTVEEEEEIRNKHAWAHLGVDPDTDDEDDSDEKEKKNDDDDVVNDDEDDVEKNVDDGDVKKAVVEDEEGAGKNVDGN